MIEEGKEIRADPRADKGKGNAGAEKEAEAAEMETIHQRVGIIILVILINQT